MNRCRRCKEPLAFKHAYVCSPCSLGAYLRSRFLSGGAWAQGQVAIARRKGLLPSPKTFTCADCGAPATEYDHRDYNLPLAVDPVCRGCNVRRGPAIPKRWGPGEWEAYVHRDTRYFKGETWLRRTLRKHPGLVVEQAA